MNDINMEMTVPQLRQFATDNQIELENNLTRKQDIFDAIQAALSSKQAAENTPQEEPPTTATGTPEGDTGTNTQPEGEEPPQGENEATGDETKTDETPEADQAADNVTETITTPPEADTPADGSTPEVEGVTLARDLRVTKPLMEGYDVAAVQGALIARNFHCGIDGASGVYNASTAYAVRLFQSHNRLIVSGKVDKFTAIALGIDWTSRTA